MPSSALVPYRRFVRAVRPGRAYYYARASPSPYIRAAAVGARYVYRNRKTLKRGIKTLGRVFKSKRKKTVRSAAMPSSKSPGVVTYDGVADATGESVLVQTLYTDSLVVPLFPTQAVRNAADTGTANVFVNAYNARDRAAIYIKGWKIHRRFALQQAPATTDARFTVHYALVQFKNVENDAAFTTEVQTMTDKFFRDCRSQGERFRNYVTSTNPATLWEMDWDTLPMNPTNNIRILWHKRKTLSPRSVSNDSGNDWWWDINTYVPFKKKMSFTTRESLLPQMPLAEVYWITTPTSYGYLAGEDIFRTYSANRIYFDNK